ncbi:MAG: hypothetical protein HDS14_07600 [Bacteroides sp.]|nr:hypothetical protein [Bacteroides sp.]
MAKEKLFTSEDFDKEPKTPKKGHIKWIIIAAIGILAILAIIFGLKGCNSDNQSQSTEISSTSVYEMQDSVVAIKVVEDVDSIVDGTYHDKESFDEQTTDKSTISIESPEKIAEPASNTDGVSNVETEALKVIRGDYGNNPERRKILGINYQSIQNRVNELKRQGAF